SFFPLQRFLYRDDVPQRPRHLFRVTATPIAHAADDCKLAAEVLMPAFAVLAFAARKARVYHYSPTLYGPDNVAAADVRKLDLFAGNANPCPYVKMVYPAVFDVNNNLTLVCNWIREFAVLQNIYRPMFEKWDGLHAKLC